MIDRTREDIAQDKKIAGGAEKLGGVEQRLARLEQDVRELRAVHDEHKATLRQHGARLNELEPLRGLLEFVESIKNHFANFRLR